MLTALILASLQVATSQPVQPRPATPPKPELVIDLLKVAPGSAVSLAAPAATFQIRLENAVPSVTYRAMVEVGGSPPTVRTQTIHPEGMPESMLRFLPTREAGCEALQKQGQALLRTTDEADIPGRIASLEKALGERVCPQFEAMVRHQISQTRPLVQWVTLDRQASGVPVKVMLERLDRATGSVQKTWRVTSGLTPEGQMSTGVAAPTSQVVPFQAERMAYRAEVRSMLGKRRFKELEERVSALRSGKERFSSGISKLVDFYRGLVPSADAPSEATAAPFEEALKAWQAEYPASITPRHGLIRLERARAFNARGLEFADKVTEQGWRGFNEHMKRAWDLAEAAKTIKEKDAEFFGLLIDLCQAGECPRERAEEFLGAGLAIDPTYDALFVSMATYLLPRWQGSVDAFTRFATRSADENRENRGNIVYVRIATVALLTEGDALPRQYPGLSWERIKQGLADLDQRFPNSARTLQLRARFACVYHDRPMATAAFKTLGGSRWNPDAAEVWSREDRLQQCYDATVPD